MPLDNEKRKEIRIPGKLSTTEPEAAPEFILKLAKYSLAFLNSHN